MFNLVQQDVQHEHQQAQQEMAMGDRKRYTQELQELRTKGATSKVLSSHTLLNVTLQKLDFLATVEHIAKL